MWEEIMQQYILFHNQIREEAKKKGQERAYKVQEAGGLDLPVPLPLLPSPPHPYNHYHLAAEQSTKIVFWL